MAPRRNRKDPEIVAMREVYTAVQYLDLDAMSRVFAYVGKRRETEGEKDRVAPKRKAPLSDAEVERTLADAELGE